LEELKLLIIFDVMKLTLPYIKPEVETIYLKLWKRDGVICGAFNNNTDVNLEVAQHCVQHRIALCEGKDRLCMIDMRGVRSSTKDAREYLASEGSRYVKAAAFIVNSTLTRAITNFFLVIHKPAVPTKLFIDEEDALVWLSKFE
jgi:hypothetical protein